MHLLIVGVGLHEVSHNCQNLCIILGTLANHTQKLVQHNHPMFEHMSIGVLEGFLGREWDAGNVGILLNISFL